MLKNILKIEGVKMLSKAEQKGIKGGYCGNCDPILECCARCRDGCYYYKSTCEAICPNTNCNTCA